MSVSPAVVAAVQQARGAHYLALGPTLAAEGFICACGHESETLGSHRNHGHEAVAAAAEAAALEAAADTWQCGAWGDTPRKADRVADRIAAANHVTAWLRERAETVREGQ